MSPSRCRSQWRRNASASLARRARWGLRVQDFAFFEGFLPELLRATAWRTRALKADVLTCSPSWISIARRTFPSRLELNRWAGSFSDAPLAKVSLTTFL